MCCLIYKFLLILTQKMQISFLKILPENALKFVSKKMRICVKNFAQLHQYLISFFFETIGEDGIRKWFSCLAEKIVKNKPDNSPLLIIINDVDSIHTGRDAFPLFVEEIERVGLNISYESRRRFKEQNYYEGSLRYENNQNIFEGEIPDRFIQDYCVAKFCESAQLILEVI